MNIYDIKFTEQELALVFSGLAKLSYEVSAPLIHALQAKIQEAHAAAVKAKEDAADDAHAEAVNRAYETAIDDTLRGD